MKTYILKRIASLLIIVGFLPACEKNDNKVCNVENPLQDIQWLNEYCENFDGTQNFSSVVITLYKVNNTDEHLFRISISYSEVDDSPVGHSDSWKDCNGNLVFGTNSGTSPNPEIVNEFLRDKEYVGELFRFVRP